MRERLKILLQITLFWIVLFMINRVLFAGIHTNSKNTLSFYEFVMSLIYGLRLDLSLASYILLLTSVVFATSTYTSRSRQIIIMLHALLIPVSVIILTVDLVLFYFWGTHFDSSAFIYAERISDLSMSLKGWQFAAALFILTLYVVFGFLIFRFMVLKRTRMPEKQPWYFTAIWLFIAALMIIPMRGGLQHIPLNTGAVYFSKNSYANYTAVNPVWNFAYSMKRYDNLSKSFNYMSNNEAKALYDNLYKSDESPVSVLKVEKPNVVLLMLESFSAGVIDHSVDQKEITPNLNKFKNEGLYFGNIYATNTRSDKGIAGILSGYPVLPGISIVKYPQKSGTLPVIPKSLEQNGYKDLTYLYGGDINFANMNSYVHIAGFENIVSKSDFSSDLYNKKWGVHDEHTLNFLLREIDQSEKPTFKTIFTLSSHEPFDVPMERVFENDYLNSVHYTDSCLGEFILQAKNSDWWDNTLIVFIADHGTKWPDYLNSNSKRYHIPMLWIGGALNVQDSVIEKIGSQTDLSVTLLNQLRVDSKEFKFGKDLLNASQKGFAFFNHNDGFSYIDDHQQHYYDLIYKDFYEFNGVESRSDSLISKAYIQTMYEDYKLR